MEKGIKKTIIAVIVGLFAVLAVGGGILAYLFYSEFLEIKEIGQQYVYVFFKNISLNVTVQVISFILTFLLIFANFLIMRNVLRKIDVSFEYFKKILPLFVISFLLAFFVSGYIKSNIATQYLNFANSVEFGAVDPIFGRDLSYYVFVRPFAKAITDSVFGVQAITTIIIFLAYILLYSRLGSFTFKDLLNQHGICVHILTNCTILLLIWSIEYRFKTESVLFSEFNGLNGSGYTQTNIWLNFYKFMPVILLTLSLIAVICIYNNKLKYALMSILVYPGLLISIFLISLFVQYIIVEPSEVQVEKPYIQRNIEYTRMAYGLDKINETKFKADNSLSKEAVSEETETLENIRVIDYDSSKIITNQLQSLRNYYQFNGLDISVSEINGKKTPVATAVREIKKDKDTTLTKNYINDKMRFTHGYGLVSMPLNKISEEGQPVFYAKDIPLTYSENSPEVTQPRIYYGETDDEYSIVNTTIKEFDYIHGEDTIENVYDGEGGLKLNSLNKAIFVLKNKDYQILVSKFITKDSKILINKNVLERVKKAVPFLDFDDNPYAITDKEGKIKWIIDAYTKTDSIPYSQMYNDEFNYIRNSAKAVVDAYDGTVKVYVTDETDPLIMAYKKMYPTAFAYEEMPEDIKKCVKYNENYFNIQIEMLKRYHTTDTTTFYNKSDVWSVANELKDDQVQTPVKPYYTMMKLDGKDSTDVVLMIPFTISEKENMVSWLAVGSDSNCYGEMTLYTFPQGKNVYGPLQIDKRINSDKDISKELTLWGQGGSTVIRGNMIVVPVENSLIYVEPIYITSEKNSFPELKAIIGSYNDKIVMRNTIGEVLAELFVDIPETKAEALKNTANEETNEFISEEPITNIEEEETTNPQNTDEIKEAYKKVKEASQNGDWVAFGEAMKELEEKIGYTEENPQNITDISENNNDNEKENKDDKEKESKDEKKDKKKEKDKEE